jgi:hypothetical protein
MTDMALLCQHAIAGPGGLARTDLAALNRSLRRNINSARDYHPPIELAAARAARPGPGYAIADNAAGHPNGGSPARNRLRGGSSSSSGGPATVQMGVICAAGAVIDAWSCR